MTKGYCSVTGKSFNLREIFEGINCYKSNGYYYCSCHNKKLVEEYPFKITGYYKPMGKTKTINRVVDKNKNNL